MVLTLKTEYPNNPRRYLDPFRVRRLQRLSIATAASTTTTIAPEFNGVRTPDAEVYSICADLYVMLHTTSYKVQTKLLVRILLCTMY